MSLPDDPSLLPDCPVGNDKLLRLFVLQMDKAAIPSLVGVNDSLPYQSLVIKTLFETVVVYDRFNGLGRVNKRPKWIFS